MIDKIINEIKVWDNWQNNYKSFVPLFIEEARTKNNWIDWDDKIFLEFFEKNRDQCVASLQQGYYSNDEKLKIKNNWNELGQMLSKISNQQDTLDLETYDKIRSWLRQHTSQNRKAAANRLIASLQPKLLCTIVNEDRIKVLMQRINKNDSSASLTISNNWFENSNRVLNYFRNKLPNKDYYDIITYPWQTYDILNNQNTVQNSTPTINNNDMSETENETDVLDILKYKKQIILQGPPGTGKTRLAKEIATALISTEDDIDLRKYLQVGQLIPNASGTQGYYTVDNVSENSVTLSSDRATKQWNASKNKILDKVEQLKNNETPKNKGGDDPYVLAIAKYIFQNINQNNENSQLKLIQFHPSYTYEDFVRGIVAKPNDDGDGILYVAEDKTLGKFAKKAWENYIASKNINTHNESKPVFDAFIAFIKDEIAQSEQHKYNITDAVYLFSSDETRFKYKGDNWVAHSKGLNMKFSELKKIIDSGATERQDIKKIGELEELTRQHATYYIKLVEMFYEFEKSYQSEVEHTSQAELKNYVLIIDEINRANLSSVLGELIYALEYRGEAVDSMYAVEDSILPDKNHLILPPNLYIIGTMNTADRSVGHIDYAIRRRFAFVDVLPEKLTDNDEIYFNEKNFNAVEAIFTRENVSSEFEIKDIQLGHSYFIAKKNEAKNEAERDAIFKMKMDYEIKPILREYLRDGILQTDKNIGGESIKDYIEEL